MCRIIYKKLDINRKLIFRKFEKEIKVCAVTIIIVINESAVQGLERVRTLSVLRPLPNTINPQKKEKEKIVGGKNNEYIRQTRRHWL